MAKKIAELEKDKEVMRKYVEEMHLAPLPATQEIYDYYSDLVEPDSWMKLETDLRAREVTEVSYDQRFDALGMCPWDRKTQRELERFIVEEVRTRARAPAPRLFLFSLHPFPSSLTLSLRARASAPPPSSSSPSIPYLPLSKQNYTHPVVVVVCAGPHARREVIEREGARHVFGGDVA